ncbi:DUF2267 domain-containing protein [Reyranella sp.]|uniref:DUF2267 domain-containing protein n=1 Tax=Reyranella sp. TaxID=1929291 RepID=UPI003BAD56A7
MPVPVEYKRASMDFEQFMLDARDISGLATTHQTYTMVQGVFQAFRRRLDVKESIRFANVLPPVLRALFVADWDLDEPRRPFADRATMTHEVQALRPDHNFAPDSSIGSVAAALRRNIDQAALDRVLTGLPPGALAFWQVD